MSAKQPDTFMCRTCGLFCSCDLRDETILHSDRCDDCSTAFAIVASGASSPSSAPAPPQAAVTATATSPQATAAAPTTASPQAAAQTAPSQEMVQQAAAASVVTAPYTGAKRRSKHK